MYIGNCILFKKQSYLTYFLFIFLSNFVLQSLFIIVLNLLIEGRETVVLMGITIGILGKLVISRLKLYQDLRTKGNVSLKRL